MVARMYSVLPPMLDTAGMATELTRILSVHDLGAKAIAGPNEVSSSQVQTETKHLLQIQYESALVSLGGLLEFALRQLVDFLAVNLIIDASTTKFAEISTLEALEKTLKKAWVSESFFQGDDWRDIRLLAMVRNKIVHVMGWHDDVEFEEPEMRILRAYGLAAATGVHSMGPVHRFILGSDTAHNVARLYARAFLQAETEYRRKVDANP